MRQWVIRYYNTRSFNAEDNKTDEEKRIKELEKKVKQLETENDILKQAALLLGKRWTSLFLIERNTVLVPCANF